jgi:uncharacterized protein (TIGR02284 family)
MGNGAQMARLNRLIVRCKDDVRTYRAAAAAHGLHRDELLALSRRRSSFAEALSGVLRRAGVAPSRYGSVAGWLRRALSRLRTTLLGETHLGDSLDACAWQESRTEAGYREALERTWSAEVDGILRTQLDEIAEAHARVRLLRWRV